MIRHDLTFSHIDKLNFMERDIECICVKLERKPPIIMEETMICCIYRPPHGDVREFVTKLNLVFKQHQKAQHTSLEILMLILEKSLITLKSYLILVSRMDFSLS